MVGEHPHFLEYARQLATVMRNAVLSDQVVYPFAYREEIMQLLEDHIRCNLVKVSGTAKDNVRDSLMRRQIGQNYYRQIVGIPQGSVLSSILCSFCYGDMERTSLRFTLEDKNSVSALVSI